MPKKEKMKAKKLWNDEKSQEKMTIRQSVDYINKII